MIVCFLIPFSVFIIFVRALFPCDYPYFFVSSTDFSNYQLKFFTEFCYKCQFKSFTNNLKDFIIFNAQKTFFTKMCFLYCKNCCIKILNFIFSLNPCEFGDIIFKHSFFILLYLRPPLFTFFFLFSTFLTTPCFSFPQEHCLSSVVWENPPCNV